MQYPDSYSTTMQHVGVHSLPRELIYEVLQYLDPKDLPKYMLICRAWQPCVQRLLYNFPRLSSARQMEGFIVALRRGRKLHSLVKGLHILGKENYSSSYPTPWVLSGLARLAPFVPGVFSLVFQHIEGIDFNNAFWGSLELFPNVTELRIEKSRFKSRSDALGLLNAFPKLRSVVLANVRWPQARGVMRPNPCPPPAHWAGRVLPLSRAEFCFMQDEELVPVLGWLARTRATLKDLSLLHVAPTSILDVGPTLSALSLSSFSFAPQISYAWQLSESFFFLLCSEKDVEADPRPSPRAEYLDPLYEALKKQTSLTSLRLFLLELAEGAMQWAPRVLEAAEQLPLASIALEFTFDRVGIDYETEAWAAVRARLEAGWAGTLRRVTLVQNPTGDFVACLEDERVFATLARRFAALAQRGLLELQIGTRYV